MSNSPGRRTIRSFVRRAGRMTSSQRRALDRLWPLYGVDYDARPLDLVQVFGRDADKVLDIGFGNGDTLVLTAAENPHIDFLGIEVHEPGIGHCLIRAREAGITNLRIVAHDAIEVLRDQIEDGSLARIDLLFPDPWPKKRHHKRRIVQATFLRLAGSKLRPGGVLCIATDWANYAEHIDAVTAASPDFTLAERREHAGDRPLHRHTTKFEKRGLNLKHRIWDWRFVRR